MEDNRSQKGKEGAVGTSRGPRVAFSIRTRDREWQFDLLFVLRFLLVALAVLALTLCLTHLARHFRARDGKVLPSPKTYCFQSDHSPSGPEILDSTHFITHAMGNIDGCTYLNCLEGFQKLYAQGSRAFEVDLNLTADGKVVLRHDWLFAVQEGISNASVPTREEFLSVPILERYTPLSFRDLLLLMEEYPDICIITDSKYNSPEVALTQFTSMVEEAEELGLAHLFDRIVIQVYNKDMLESLERVYHFPHYIFTLYLTGFGGEIEVLTDFAEYCMEHQVEGITMWDYLWDPAFLEISQKYNVPIYVHTVNDAEQARSFLEQGVKGVYSDELTDPILAGAF